MQVGEEVSTLTDFKLFFCITQVFFRSIEQTCVCIDVIGFSFCRGVSQSVCVCVRYL